MQVITIGRSRDNDYVINDPSVSRHHSQIILTDDGNYKILDMGSVNGTYVNGQRITGETSITVTDLIQVGKVELDWDWAGFFVIDRPASARSGGKHNKGLLIAISIVAGILLVTCVIVILYFSRERSLAQEKITNLTETNEQYMEDIKSSQDENERQKELKGVYSDALENAKKKSEDERKSAEKDMARAKAVSDSIRNELEEVQKNYKKMQKSSEENVKSLRNEMENKINDLSSKKAAADAELERIDKELSAIRTQHQAIVDNMEEFYSLLDALSAKECKVVCDELGYAFSEESGAKTELIRRFRGGDVDRIMVSLRARKERGKLKEVSRISDKDTVEVKDLTR